MGIFTDDYSFEKRREDGCPCCKCDAHWMACKFCEHYETRQSIEHMMTHTKK